MIPPVEGIALYLLCRPCMRATLMCCMPMFHEMNVTCHFWNEKSLAAWNYLHYLHDCPRPMPKQGSCAVRWPCLLVKNRIPQLFVGDPHFCLFCLAPLFALPQASNDPPYGIVLQRHGWDCAFADWRFILKCPPSSLDSLEDVFALYSLRQPRSYTLNLLDTLDETTTGKLHLGPMELAAFKFFMDV